MIPIPLPRLLFRFEALLLPALLLCALTLPNSAFAARGEAGQWFIGFGGTAFELNGSGTVSTFENANTEFNVKRFNSFGLVTDKLTTSETSLGLGWQDQQLPGYSFHAGYRHNWWILSRLEITWALPKTSDLYSLDFSLPGITNVSKQSTVWTQKRVRLMVDITPFEPLPYWFFTAGVEYTSFEARLEFFADDTDLSGTKTRDFLEYVDGGSTFGFVIGSGLILPGGSSRRESYASFTYAYSPFTSEWFAWDSDIDVGGMGLEIGMRFYFAGKR